MKLLAAALFLPFALAQGEDPLQVRGVRYAMEGDETVITVEVSGDFEYVAGRLHQPERAYFDILDSQPRFGPSATYTKELDEPAIQRVRIAETAPDVTRVVLDLRKAADLSVAKLLNPPRLRIASRAAAAEKSAEKEAAAEKGASAQTAAAPGSQVPPPTPAIPPAPLPPVPETNKAPPAGPASAPPLFALALLAVVIGGCLLAYLGWAIRRLSQRNDDAFRALGEALSDQAVDHKRALAISERHAANGERGAEAASLAADAMAKMVAQLKQEQRAWIIVSPPKVARLAELRRIEELGAMPSAQPLYVPVLVTNRGHGLAFVQQANAKLMVLPEERELPPEPAYEGETSASISGNIPLPPNSPYHLLTPSLEQFEFAGIHRSVRRLWLYGFIDYSDTSGERHQTRFCFVYHHQAGFSPQSADFYIAGPEGYNSFT